MKDYIFTSESVTEGHPDKICDQIADAIVDAALAQDPYSNMAVECTIKDDFVLIYGECNTKAELDYETIALNEIKRIGYTEEYHVHTVVNQQSPEIHNAVNRDEVCAGDQGIMFGYACDETENYMPFAIDMAHKLAKQLTKVRKENIIPYLRPDGKTQVTVEYENDKPKRIETILISNQHLADVDMEQMKQDIIEKVIKPIVPEKYIDENTKIYVNPTGRFVIGGPLGDTGLTGRKLIVDTYGGYSRHGGGAFSGKDASKVDRSASYMLRHIAKNIVANGYAKKCEIQVSYAIGMEQPLSVYVDTFGTGTIPEEKIVELIKEKFDLTPNGIIKYLDLKKPIYKQTTNYGHFGKENLSWEKINIL